MILFLNRNQIVHPKLFIYDQLFHKIFERANNFIHKCKSLSYTFDANIKLLRFFLRTILYDFSIVIKFIKKQIDIFFKSPQKSQISNYIFLRYISY